MSRVIGLSDEPPNFAWCFDCVPEENSLLLRSLPDFDGRWPNLPLHAGSRPGGGRVPVRPDFHAAFRVHGVEAALSQLETFYGER